MNLDLLTLAFIECLTYVAQVIALLVQFTVNRTDRGIRWWLSGSALSALGVILTTLVNNKALIILAMLANPLIVSGQLLLYVGMVRFLDKKENRLLLISFLVVFVVLYYWFIFANNDMSARTLDITAALAFISLLTASTSLTHRDRSVSGSVNFTGVVFFAYGCFSAARMVLVLTSPRFQSFADTGMILPLAYLVPLIASLLWTYGFIIMVNQRLDAENRLVALHLETEKKAAELMSMTDSLTGLANRRYFDKALNMEFQRLKRSGAPLTLIMLDVDHFKKFNDSYGHLAGDDCLRRIGLTLKSHIRRAADILARYGGEEFVAILTDTDPDGAVILAEQIRKAVEALAIPHAASGVAPVVTVSLGVVTAYPVRLSSADQVVALADEAMYVSKKGGRNRTTVSTEEGAPLT